MAGYSPQDIEGMLEALEEAKRGSKPAIGIQPEFFLGEGYAFDKVDLQQPSIPPTPPQVGFKAKPEEGNHPAPSREEGVSPSPPSSSPPSPPPSPSAVEPASEFEEFSGKKVQDYKIPPGAREITRTVLIRNDEGRIKETLTYKMDSSDGT